MLWLVQQNLYKEHHFNELVSALITLNINFKIVKVNANNEIIEVSSNGNFITELSINQLNQEKEIMVCGGHKLNLISQKNNWKPGMYQNENFNFLSWKQNFGSENLLNGDAIVKKLNEVNNDDIKMNHFFVRPIEDSKSFSGKIFDKQFFFEWQKNILENKASSILVGETEILLSPLKNIYSETRFFIINGEIITQSIYKLGNQVYFNETVDSQTTAFAHEMIKKWQPHDAYVLDVAQIEEGYKIIEINTINAAGFYNADVTKIVFYLDNIKDLKKESKKQLKY